MIHEKIEFRQEKSVTGIVHPEGKAKQVGGIGNFTKQSGRDHNEELQSGRESSEGGSL
jgi:hypothetical protein